MLGRLTAVRRLLIKCLLPRKLLRVLQIRLEISSATWFGVPATETVDTVTMYIIIILALGLIGSARAGPSCSVCVFPLRHNGSVIFQVLIQILA
jgi:hypothetical protein